MKQGLTTTAPSKRLAIYAKLLTLVGRDLPDIGLFHEPYYGAISTKFTWDGFSFGSVVGSTWPLDIKPR
jgi:hypothetical protein